MDKKKQINLLSNEPCREDAFEGHSHQSIADQIARLIKEDNQRHIIGIEGGWGSGKSNLISLVNKDLNGQDVYDGGYNHANSRYPFFIYDAWGHQADYQRRAILEELTRDLTFEKKILDGEKWKQKLQELLAKRKKTTTKEVPRLGIGVITSIILCAITPLIVFFVNLIPLDKWWWRLLIAIAPYLCGFIIALSNRIRSLKQNEQDVTFYNLCSELILVYKDQIKENETYTTISEKEPSSTEFKAWMDEVDKDLKKLNQTLIIVFDNMDRLPSQKVESLWSSIHSFFSDKTYDNIKVIIPFDREHVQYAFKGEGGEYGNDFINKTFDVVFRVPPPIMSGWQQYMADLWKQAFGEEEALDISVTQVYDALSKNHTPRKIIAFINEVATVKMTMGDAIPDRYIALFVLGKEAIERDPVGQMLNPEFMGEVKFEFEKDSDTVKYLSALYYQLPADRALDVVFTKEATEALNTGNAERLHEMMEHMDLPPVIGKAILKVSEVEKATMALAKLDEYYGFSEYGDLPSWLKQIWNSLYQKSRSMDIVFDEIKDFHIQLFTHLYDDSLAEDLVNGYLSIEDDKWNAEQYVKTIDKLKVNNDIIDRKLKRHKRKVTPKLLLELLKYTGANYEEYGLVVDLDELDNYLAGLKQNDVIEIEEISLLSYDVEIDFPKYKAKLKEWLKEANGIKTNDVIKLFARLKEVSDKPLDFEKFFDDESLYNEWCELSGTSDMFRYDLLAMRVARRSNLNNLYAAEFKVILENYEDEDVEALAKVIEYYVNIGDLLMHSYYYKDYPLIKAVVSRLISKRYGVSRMDLMECLVHFDKTVEDYQIDEMLLLDRMNGWVGSVDFDRIKVDRMPSGVLSAAAKEPNLELSRAIHAACEEHYTTQIQDQWKEHILKKDSTYRIWMSYHPKKYQAFFDAFKSILKDYSNGTSTNQPDKDTVNELLTICVELKHSVKTLFNDISSILKRGLINKAKLLFFGEYILKYADSEKQSDFVVKLIPTEIIDADVIGFVYEHIEQLMAFEIPDDFKEKVRHLAETSMKNDERIVAICQKIGVALSQSE